LPPGEATKRKRKSTLLRLRRSSTKAPFPSKHGSSLTLKGYVAFYVRDYKTALEELTQANQNDPFIQCMIGQTYEKLGDKERALEYYRKASTASSHNPPAAYAVPFAKKKLS